MTRKVRKKTVLMATVATACLLAGMVGMTGMYDSISAMAGVLSANGKYYSNYDSYEELLEAVGEINTEAAEEGMVLLKNDGTLPLVGSERISLFGIASSTTVAGPSSGDAYWSYTDDSVSARGPVYDSLVDAGFNVNPTLSAYYAQLGFSTSDIGNETLDFSNEAKNSINLYDDVGIIVLSRYGGEGSDLDLITDEKADDKYGDQKSSYTNDALYRGTYVGSSTSSSGFPGGMGSVSFDVSSTSANYDADGEAYKHYLMLTDSEEELIDYVAGKCDKVIVLLNTSNAMECYNLREDDRINGIMLMGRGGDTGCDAIGELLSGLINPSGKLVDEWNTDFTADPTWNNYSWNAQTGSQNMYYNGTYGTGLMTEYTGNGNYDDYLTRGTTTVSYGSHNQNAYYGTDYEEDIYLGYAYWETLYYEIYNALLTEESVTYQGNGVTHTVSKNGRTAAEAANEWWNENVCWAFGYGLSYTSFSYNIDASKITATGGALESADETAVSNFDIYTSMTTANLSSSEGKAAKIKTLTIPVTVTNTGSYSGKETVQIYVTAPYDTTTAKLEKSYVTLVGFGKTDTLKPGQSQTIYIDVNVQDMASFDYNDAYGTGTDTGYTLDAGEYTIRAMASSHFDVATDTKDTTDAYDEVKFEITDKARLDLDDFSGNVSTAIFSEDYDTVAEVNGNKWDTDTDSDHYQVYNSLRTSNLMADGESEEVLLTRATILSYFPEAPTEGDLTFSTSYVEHLDYWNQFSAADTSTDDWYKSSVDEDWKQGTGVVDEETGTYAIVLSDMVGKELFDDDGNLTAAWNKFMNQLTVDEMTTLIRKNFNMWRSTGLDNIGKAANQQKDSYNNNGDTLLWVDAPTITATWNTELAYDIGVVRGNLSLYNGWSAWGGPEMDTHRSPFSGRNYEYMSQDGLVGGYMAAGLTAGMESMGVTCYIKHFALNDQETCRDGMENMVWVSEQAARQIYFKVFQICMQEGGSSSSMTGFARFCGIPTSSNNNLMENMVCDQWGWTGFFITDGYSGFSRCTTMSTMMKSYVVPLPLNSAIPMISGRYEAAYDSNGNEIQGTFYAYTGAWDTELEYKDSDGNDILTDVYNDRGEYLGTTTGYYQGEEVESNTQWYYMRMLAARILYKEANALTNLNGHSLTTLPTISDENLTVTQGEEVSLSFDLSGEAANCFNEDGSTNYTTEYSVSGDLPSGLSFDASTGTLSGTPTEVGQYTFTVSVVIDGWVSADLVNDDNDSINGNLRKSYTMTVESGFYLEDADGAEVTSLALNAGDSFAAYIKSSTISATTDDESLAYSIASGTLPDGLTLNASTGTITGSVSSTAANGTYDVVINVAKSVTSTSSGGDMWGWGWGGGGSSTTTTNYTYALSFTVSGGAEDSGDVEETVYLTEDEIMALIQDAIADIDIDASGLTESEVNALIESALSGIDTSSLTEAEVQELIDAAIADISTESGCSGDITTNVVTVVSLLAAAAVVCSIIIVARKKRDSESNK